MDNKTLSTQMLTHLELLRFEYIFQYKRWCKKLKLSVSMDKNLQQRQKEIRLRQNQSTRSYYDYDVDYTELLRDRKVKSNHIKNEIHLLFEKSKWDPSDHPNGPLRRIAVLLNSICTKKTQPVALRKFKNSFKGLLLLYLSHNRGKGLREEFIVDSLTKLALNWKYWNKEADAWKPESKNCRKQIISIYEFLMIKYQVPTFFYPELLKPDKNYDKVLQWYLHIGNGGNIRTAKKLPIALTKKMAHFFLQTPTNLNVDQAFRWGQIRAMGADTNMTKAIVQMRLGSTFKNDDFWITVIRFFIDNPWLNREHYGPIEDYLNFQRFQPQWTVVNGVQVQIPPQPNLTMKGRSVQKLLQDVRKWHRGLNTRSSRTKLNWLKSELRDVVFEEGVKENKIFWSFKELTSSIELAAEGAKMQHCVYSYDSYCARGNCSIWSLCSKDKNGYHNELTIEISIASKAIVQLRGKCNKLATSRQARIIRRFATFHNLSVLNL